MDADLFYSLLVFLLLLCSFFFSGSETAITGVSQARIYRKAQEGNKRAILVLKLHERREDMVGALLIGNNMVNIAATAISTSLAISWFGKDGVVYATAVLTIMVVIFAEIMPKTYALQHANRFALFVSPVLWVIMLIFSPLTQLLVRFSRCLMCLLKLDRPDGDQLSASEILRGTIELHHQEGEVIKRDRDMLGSILDLSEVEVSEVMIHRKEVETINIEQPASKIIHQILRSRHSRLPVWRDDPDNIIGLLHTKDVSRIAIERGESITQADIESVMSDPWYIPDTTALIEQLHSFRQRRRHFAMVVDEYGAFLGVITLEDIIEEIVGDIDDEYDRLSSDSVRPLQDGSYIVDGSVTIRDLNRAFDWHLPDEHANTIAGLVMHETRSIPEIGASFIIHGFEVSVTKKRSNQLVKLKLRQIL